MAWLFVALVQVYFIYTGIRQEQSAGEWSWSKFFFAIAFAGLEFGIIVTPLYLIDPHSRYFLPVSITAGIVAALNFIWFIIVCRRWRLPDGRASLQAWHDDHPDK
jgi:hypothetical protein